MRLGTNFPIKIGCGKSVEEKRSKSRQKSKRHPNPHGLLSHKNPKPSNCSMYAEDPTQMYAASMTAASVFVRLYEPCLADSVLSWCSQTLWLLQSFLFFFNGVPRARPNFCLRVFACFFFVIVPSEPYMLSKI